MKTLHVHKNGQWQEVVGAPAGLEGYYTKVEADGKFATTDTTTLITTQMQAVFDSIYTKAEADDRYARRSDATQTVVAGTVRADRHEFTDNAALAWEDVGGTARPVYKAGSKTFPLAFTSEITAGGSVDLSAYAKMQDNQQAIVSKTVTASAYGFGDSLLPPVALAYVDTGEGYGSRLVLNVGVENEYLVLKSDLDSLNALLPRVESLENKSAPSVDLSGYVAKPELDYQAKRLDAVITETGVLSSSLASYAEKANTYTKAEADALFKAPDLTSYAKAEWVAAWVDANAYKKSDTYTRAEVDAKVATFTTAADVATFAEANYAPKATTYTKVEVDDLIARTPSPMEYLQWGGAFTKVLGAAAKDKWTACGLIPSIRIVKGKHYRLEMTTKLGPLNADYKECWVGFRFNYRDLNELPCTKQPLVTMGGFGHTTVTRARAAIAATAVATTTPTRADRFRLLAVDDWLSAEDLIEYAVEFEADRDIANANFVPEICIGGAWGVQPTNIEGVVAVFRQMD